MDPARQRFADEAGRKDPTHPKYATETVDALLAAARDARASDVHLVPTADGLDVRWRVDGVLHDVARLPSAIAPNIVARLKVLAELLTYRTEIPQEGRIRGAAGSVEVRVSTFPTLHGEKAVIRLFAAVGRYEHLTDLGLPSDIQDRLASLLDQTTGMILFSGPAGSGKTTTIYACLREILKRSGGRRSVATLEDPIEVAVPGVSQSQVAPQAGFDLEVGLRSLLRQDAEVITVGEIRDRRVAEVAFQAALSGHLVLTTLHAGSGAGVFGRLADMGIEPYVLRSGVLAVLSQRLVRALCLACASSRDDPKDYLGLAVTGARVPVGCSECGTTGYLGRLVLAELLVPDDRQVGRAILDRRDVARLESEAIAAGMVPIWRRALDAVARGSTSPAEIRRVLGLPGVGGSDDTP